MTPKGNKGCVVYSHYPTIDSYSKCIYSCCLPYYDGTKHFGILQTVLNNQRVYITIYLNSGKVDNCPLRKIWLN